MSERPLSSAHRSVYTVTPLDSAWHVQCVVLVQRMSCCLLLMTDTRRMPLAVFDCSCPSLCRAHSTLLQQHSSSARNSPVVVLACYRAIELYVTP